MTRSALFVLCATSLVCLFLCSNASAVRPADLLRDGYTVEDSLFHRIYRKGNDQYDFEYGDDRELNFAWLRRMARQFGSPSATNQTIPDSYWDWLPAQMGTVFTSQSYSWEGTCFGQLTATLTVQSTNGTLEIDTTKKKHATCSEFYMFCSRESCHLRLFEFSGKHTIQLQWRNYEQADVQQHGLFIFLYPLGLEQTVISVVKTVSLFLDPYPGMVQANVEFLGEKLEWAMHERTDYTSAVNISESDIKSGDYLAIARLDGLDPLIMWGTGGHTGHTAVALWFDGELYICESTDAEGGSLTYWPPPYGIIRTPFQQWVKQAMEAEYLVAILRLAPQYQQNFNETAANQWFYSVQGQPYGWHNFLFTFLDTVTENLPRPVTPDLFEVVMGVAERLIPIDAKSSIYNMLIQGLNHRLNSNCTTLQCVYNIIDPQARSLSVVTAIPEQDSWRYGGNYSMVCDVFVCEMYKNAGVFGTLSSQFQCTEQTPKDTYQMAIFDGNWKRPAPCVRADPQLPYCQLMGKYVLSLPGYNQIPPYVNMNNNCSSLPPVYYRPVGC